MIDNLLIGYIMEKMFQTHSKKQQKMPRKNHKFTSHL